MQFHRSFIVLTLLLLCGMESATSHHHSSNHRRQTLRKRLIEWNSAPILTKSGESTNLYSSKCLVGRNSNTYDVRESYKVPWLTVNLDEAPKTRFADTFRPFSAEIRGVTQIVKDFVGMFGKLPIEIMEMLMREAHKNLFPSPYKEEIQGIADATGVSVADLAMLNVFYEFSRFCTSIIAENRSGQLYHARNLDFGQLFAWNVSSHIWVLTEALKKLTVNINFVKNGKTLFKSTTFAGHVGIITGMKPNAFTLSMNSQLKPDIRNLLSWLSGILGGPSGDPNGGIEGVLLKTHRPLSRRMRRHRQNSNNSQERPPRQHFVMWTEREVMEKCDSYADAKRYLSEIPLIAGCYFILGGRESDEGVVIVRDAKKVTQYMNLNVAAGKWFLLQTNYDPDQRPFFLDNRQDPGEHCMNELGQHNLSVSGLYEVLSSKTTKNKTTVHTVIMSLYGMIYETFIQHCPDPCWFI